MGTNDPIMQGLAGPGHTSKQSMTFQDPNNSHNANVSNHHNISYGASGVYDAAKASQFVNASGHNISLDNSALPKNLEQTLLNLEDAFWYILNNPICYNEIIYRFFNKSGIFSMFPHCEAFFKQYRLTGRAMIQPQPTPLSPTNIIRTTGSSVP